MKTPQSIYRGFSVTRRKAGFLRHCAESETPNHVAVARWSQKCSVEEINQWDEALSEQTDIYSRSPPSPPSPRQDKQIF